MDQVTTQLRDEIRKIIASLFTGVTVDEVTVVIRAAAATLRRDRALADPAGVCVDYTIVSSELTEAVAEDTTRDTTTFSKGLVSSLMASDELKE